jgi:transposase
VASHTPAHAAGKPIEIWFQDEARVGQKGTLTYVWGLKGSRPRAIADQRYACAYIFGAICPAKGTGAALVLPFANTDAMNQHLLEISRHVTPGSHAMIIMDGAGWHTAHALKVPDNITLIKLPPYSPELNSQENIWQYLRQNHLANRIFDTYTDIVDACCSAWNALIALPENITSIGNRNWINTVYS